MENIFGKLQAIYDNPQVIEIIIDAPDDVYWCEGQSIKQKADLFKDQSEITQLTKQLLSQAERRLEDIKQGYADFRLAEGTQVILAAPPLNPAGPSLVIKKPVKQDFHFEDLIKWGAIDKNGRDICLKLLEQGKNILVAGNAGSGKTTLVNILVENISPQWRVITTERVITLDIKKRKRTLQFECPTGEQKEISDLIQKAQSMRADYIVVNELMGPETFECIKCMREGYSVLATLSAETVGDALRKSELMCLMGQLGLGPQEIRHHVASGVDAVIYQERLSSGKRVVTQIALVEDVNELGKITTAPLFSYDEESEQFTLCPSGEKFLQNT